MWIESGNSVRKPPFTTTGAMSEFPLPAGMDAYQFVSQNARAPIVQIVDPNYTVLVKIEKRRLPFPSSK
jgi:hypothetical protein